MILSDIWFGVRNLAKSPGFAAIALASLMLGIGGTVQDVDHLMSAGFRIRTSDRMAATAPLTSFSKLRSAIRYSRASSRPPGPT